VADASGRLHDGVHAAEGGLDVRLSIHTNQRLLFGICAISYVVLVAVCAVWPAILESQAESKREAAYEDPLILRGRDLYRAYNCVACHTQQIRGDERLASEIDGRRIVPVLAADARFGREVASQAEEYAFQRPPFMGTQRTGPDLSSVGVRLPDAQWHYWHLYAPQAVSPDSLMPPHAFLFTTKEPVGDGASEYERVLTIEGLGVPDGRLWATPDARALVAYLQSLDRHFIEQQGLGR